MKPKNKVITLPTPHPNSIIHEDFGRVDYSDAYSVVYNGIEKIDIILSKLFSLPQWVLNLLKIRDKLVGSFGLITGKERLTQDYYPVGSKAVFFKVIARNENEIVMAEDDKHLNFRTSVLTESDGKITTIYQSTIVHYNNIWGRLYFLPVKPIHRIIMKLLLRNVN